MAVPLARLDLKTRTSPHQGLTSSDTRTGLISKTPPTLTSASTGENNQDASNSVLTGASRTEHGKGQEDPVVSVRKMSSKNKIFRKLPVYARSFAHFVSFELLDYLVRHPYLSIDIPMSTDCPKSIGNDHVSFIFVSHEPRCPAHRMIFAE